MNSLATLISATRQHAELRITVDATRTTIELWTHPAPADARQSLLARAENTSTELAALDLLDQCA